jgi:2-phosphosulfolactate phosphatase
MVLNIEVLLSPAEYQVRAARGFAGDVCVVFDVLRATSVMVTGLANGAAGFIPVAEISEALALNRRQPGALLAGEREGVRITATRSGGVEFDFGNSPREYTSARVAGHTIITTTTNGTRALRACVSAEQVAVGSFLNLTATAEWLLRNKPARLVLVCAGTAEFAAMEDILCAGALCDLLVTAQPDGLLDDSAAVARWAYRNVMQDLFVAVSATRNGRRLLANPELRGDLAFCVQRDIFPVVALLGHDGVIRLDQAGK